MTAVNGLSFDVAPGTVTGFLGPNSAGKTTTLRILLGLVSADAGTATHRRPLPTVELPEPLGPAAPCSRRRASTRAGLPARSCGSQARLAADADASRIEDVLDLRGAHCRGQDRRIGGFSLGMRQRLGIAGALLGHPPAAILDEPANGLDPEGIRWMRGLLRGFAAGGGTVLLSVTCSGKSSTPSTRWWSSGPGASSPTARWPS